MAATLSDVLRECSGGIKPEYLAKYVHDIPDAPVVDRTKFLVERCMDKRVLSLGSSGPTDHAIWRAFFRALLAPLFCMGFFHATRKRKITSLSVTAGIILLVVLVRAVPQPWRGIIDLGVVIGLTWGIVSIIIFTMKAFFSDTFDYSPEVPEHKDA